ncbi:MAG: replicative DNA helicase [Rhizobiales bacterium]|nr:replicative DNA helicase [Hyphomicrobiales bacterium]
MSTPHPQTAGGALSAGALPASAETPAFRRAPHNIEAEQALLGALLRNNEAHDRVSSFLKADHFYEPLHGRIFDLISQLVGAGKSASPITLKTFLESAEPVGELTVPQYLVRLVASAPAIINVAEYGRAIYDLAVRRSLITIGEDLVNVAYDSPIELPPERQIEEAESRLYSLAETGKYGQGFESFNHAVSQAVDMAAAAYQRDGGLSGIATGLRDLDAKMGGLQSSDLIILAGRPSMGKTSLATNIAFNIAQAYRPGTDGSGRAANGAVVGFFSLEMSSEQLATRILAEAAEVPSEKIRRGMIDSDEFQRLSGAAKAISTLPLYIDQTGGLTIAQLAARARRLKRQKGVGLLVVDYIQLLSGSSRSQAGGRVQEITEITTGLKALAKELQVPIIALSQLSRQVESREDKRPQLSDLRESGSIEQDADVVMFVFREEYYLERTEPRPDDPKYAEWRQKREAVRGQAEVIIGKQRHGPTGTVVLQFEGAITRFSDLAPGERLPQRYE